MLLLLSVFGAAFLAGTFVPFSSEAAVVAAAVGGHEPWPLWTAATAGNTLGAVVNWLVGRGALRWAALRRPERTARRERVERWYARFGAWTLLLAWLPLFGTLVTVVAGGLRVRLLPFVLLVAAGKGARYAVVLWLVD